MLNFLLEFLVAAAGPSFLLPVTAYMAFAGALTAFNAGIAHLCGRQPPWKLMATILVVSLLVRLSIDGMERESLTRLVLYQMPYFAMQTVGAAIAWRFARSTTGGRLLATLLSLSSVHYLVKPFVAVAAGGAGSGPDTYIATDYALFSQTSATVLGVAIALLLLVILVHEILTDITEQSLTDKLSGLLNRRGFEERLAQIMGRETANGLPVSLVICDLDRFKTINDSWGHAAGDRVIAAFSGLLKKSTEDRQFAARIGGEEFAIVLPGSNLSAARLFAESVRSSFAMLGIPGMPGAQNFTASFGIAELERCENALALQERADAALYEAKRKGRDRVEISISRHRARLRHTQSA